MSLWRRSAYQTLLKALIMSRATARAAPDLLIALVNLSDTTGKTWAHIGNHKMGPIYWTDQFASFSKILLITKRRLKVLGLSPAFLNTKGPHTRLSSNLRNRIPLYKCWKDQLICMKVQINSSSEPKLPINCGAI